MLSSNIGRLYFLNGKVILLLDGPKASARGAKRKPPDFITYRNEAVRRGS